MKFSEIYCNNCKKTLGRYNVKFYTEEKLGELINSSYAIHVKSGHHIVIRRFEK